MKQECKRQFAMEQTWYKFTIKEFSVLSVRGGNIFELFRTEILLNVIKISMQITQHMTWNRTSAF